MISLEDFRGRGADDLAGYPKGKTYHGRVGGYGQELGDGRGVEGSDPTGSQAQLNGSEGHVVDGNG